MTQKVFFASDHAGVAYKQALKPIVEKLGYSVIDLGPDSNESVDYPDFAHQLCTELLRGDGTSKGVLICGTGVGMSMAANRHQGIRAVVCADALSAKMSRAHNDANVLCLGARIIGLGTAEELLQNFLTTEFEGGRHERRVSKIESAH